MYKNLEFLIIIFNKDIFTYFYNTKSIYNYRIRRCPVPPLSSPPVNLEESRSLKKFSTKNFM